MPVWPSVTESDPENLRGKSGIAARRFATALEANSAPAAARELRWRKSRRSMVTSMGHQREKPTPHSDARKQQFVSREKRFGGKRIGKYHEKVPRLREALALCHSRI